PERAVELLRQALDLWRGPALADIKEPFARAAAAGLEEQRLGAVEDRIEIELALGQHHQLVHELESLAASHPFRERLRGQLMLALYRSGRQADSLQAYADARRMLVDELGLEPSRELQELQRRVLAHDPSLDAEAQPSADAPFAAQRRPKRNAAVGTAIVIATASVVAASLLLRGGGTSIALASRSVTRLDAATGKPAGATSLGAKAVFIATDRTGAWAATAEGTIVHVNARDSRVDRTASIDFVPSDLVVQGDVWVGSSTSPRVVRVSPRYDRAIAQVVLPRPSERVDPVGAIAPRLAAGGGSIWVAESQTTVVQIDARTNTIRRIIRPPTGASGAITYGAGAVWVGG